ncbi:MAG TPA: hypothetical protein VGM20_03995 [Gemmatimonadales bacterium]|jgi:hypothetical protein
MWARTVVPALVVLSACSTIGMSLPYDDAPPEPVGGRVKPSVGWLTTKIKDDDASAPEGSIAIDIVHIGGRVMLQQVRHFTTGERMTGDSVLLDRTTLRPIATWRWTNKGTYIVHYNRRVVERIFRSINGSTTRRIETEDVEPYSALGMELVIASMPLGGGYHGLIPVVVDTAPRGWEWLRFEVQTEMDMQERPDMAGRELWVVSADIGPVRTRLWIAAEGRSVRRIELVNRDNELLGVVRRLLLGLPQGAKPTN